MTMALNEGLKICWIYQLHSELNRPTEARLIDGQPWFGHISKFHVGRTTLITYQKLKELIC